MLFEDGVACIGVVVAATCIHLSVLTGNPVYDAVGSMVIGSLLGAVSAVLISMNLPLYCASCRHLTIATTEKNREFLIGRAMPLPVQNEIVDMLKNDPVIYCTSFFFLYFIIQTCTPSLLTLLPSSNSRR